jgi:hypothetical protein
MALFSSSPVEETVDDKADSGREVLRRHLRSWAVKPGVGLKHISEEVKVGMPAIENFVHHRAELSDDALDRVAKVLLDARYIGGDTDKLQSLQNISPPTVQHVTGEFVPEVNRPDQVATKLFFDTLRQERQAAAAAAPVLLATPPSYRRPGWLE